MMDASGIRAAIASSDWDRVAAILRGRLGVDVGPDWVRAACNSIARREWECHSGCLGPRGSGESVLIWMKSRVIEAGLIGPGMSRDSVERLTVELHIGFLFLRETAEMLSRLAEPESGPEPESVARSRVFRTPLVPRPIDIVAARVAPEK